MTSKKLRVWIEGAIVAALAIGLSFIPTNIGSSFSISLGMIPLTIYSIRRGVKAGLFAGLIWGLLHFLFAQVVWLSATQVLIEYVVAFTFAGFAGLFSKQVVKAVAEKNVASLRKNIIFASLVGCVFRYFWHFVAGMIFWGEYALWGLSPFAFSLVMNGITGLATAIATSGVLIGISTKYSRVFTTDEQVQFGKGFETSD